MFMNLSRVSGRFAVPQAANAFSVAAGGLLWLGSWFWGTLSSLQILFLLAPLVILPLGLPLLALPDRQGKNSTLLLIRFQPLAALSLLGSFALPPGSAAAALALPWLLFTFSVGLYGLLRHLPHGFVDAGEVCLDAALLFLPVGGIWLMASRMGLPLMGFQEPIVLLTAVHFHFAGFAACTLVGLSGRLGLPRRLYRMIVVGVLSGIPLLALGIAFAPVLEVISALVFALSLSALALLWLSRWAQIGPGKYLLGLSAISVLVSMGFALAYTLSEFLGLAWLPIPVMIQNHGALNALGFALLGLLAFRRINPNPQVLPPGIPFSRLVSKGFVGPDFFQRSGAIPDAPTHLPTGLVDDLTSFRRQDFEPQDLDPGILHFYQHTADYKLYVVPQWQPGFRLGGRLWRWLMERIGQLCLPVTGESRRDQINSLILPLDAERDGRNGARAWVRTYTESGRTVYVAAYAQHQWQEQVYMNIAFALPFSQMSSILRLEPIELSGHSHDALRLTTLAETLPGDQGVYLVLQLCGRSLPLRLPLNESISIWPSSMTGSLGLVLAQSGSAEHADAPLLARHQMWISGLHFLTLDYFIYPVTCHQAAQA